MKGSIMDNDLFRGELVRLTAENADTAAAENLKQSRSSEFWRLQTSDPHRLYSRKAIREWYEKRMFEPAPDAIEFMIRTLADDRLIGHIELDGISWNHGDAYVGIGIGPGDWGKGYGTDAMRILLRYAFTELNLHRVTLNVFEYNPRAIRSYEKAGFKYEGRVRKFLVKDGKEYDMVHMGILRSEWLRLQTSAHNSAQQPAPGGRGA